MLKDWSNNPLILAVLAVLLVVSYGCSRPLDLEASHTFEEAGRAFLAAKTSEDFLRTASLYKSILDSGHVSGAILYNLGNAYLKANRKGQAIAAYRRALRYRPRDPYLEANLNHTLGSVKAPTNESKSLLYHIFFWQGWISYPNKFKLLAVAATLTFVLALLALVLDAYRQEVRRAMWISLGVAVLLGASAGLDVYNIELTRHGVVTAPEVVARKGNSESYEPAFTEPLQEGIEFTVVEQRGNWLRIRLAKGLDSWVPENKAVIY